MAFFKCVPIRKAVPPAVLPLYPLEDASFSHPNYIIATTKDGHVRIQNKGTIGIRSIYKISYTDSVNNRPVWFELHNGDVVTVKFKNMTATVTGGTLYVAINFRKANASTSSAFLSSGNLYKADFVDFEKTVNITSTEQLGAFFLYSNYPTAFTVEFDFEMWVNGIRYI